MSRRTLQDLGIAALAGVLVMIGPYTPDRLLPSLAAGFGTGVVVLAFRLWLRRRAPEAPRVGPEAPSAREAVAEGTPLRAGSLLLIGAGLALLAAVFAPTARFLYHWWTLSIWRDAHGLLTPFVVAYLAYAILRQDRDRARDASPWGFAFLAAGLALAVLDSAIKTQHLSAIALVICLPGLSLLLLGTRRTLKLRLPLFVSLFMIPIPYFWATHLYLRTITTSGVAWVLDLMGVSFLRDGTQLTLPRTVFVVSDACSGFSALYAAMGLAVILSIYSHSWVRKLGVVLAAFGVAMISNILRVVLLVLMTERYGHSLLDTAVHPASGVFTFALVLGALFLFADRQRLREALT